MTTVFCDLAAVTMEELFAGRLAPSEAKAQLRVSAQMAFEIEMTNRMSSMKRSFGHVSAYDDTDRHYESHPRTRSRKTRRTGKENL